MVTIVDRARGPVRFGYTKAVPTGALFGYELFVIGYVVFVLRRQVTGRIADRLRRAGTDPVGYVGFSGMIMFLSVAFVASLFCIFAGLPIAHVYVAVVLSIAGMSIWSWWHHRYVRKSRTR